MQSKTASLESFESLELRNAGDRGSYAALQYVSRNLNLTVAGMEGPVETGEEETRRVSTNAHRLGEVPSPSRRTPRDHRKPGRHADRGAEEPVRSAVTESATEAPANPVAGGVAESSGLVHDMGNLLGALGLYAELLAVPGVLHEEFQGYAKELRQLSERSSAMMVRLVNRQKQHNDTALVSVSEVVVRMRGLLHRVAGRAIEVDFAVGSHRLVDVNEEAVERILTNLIKNAGEAMGAGDGRITVRLEGTGTELEPRVLLSVTDEGCGMNSTQLGSLGGAVHPATNGRGLGFRVVRELAAITGGMLGIASEPGHGTTVTVEWNAVEQMEIETEGATRRVMRGAAGWIGC